MANQMIKGRIEKHMRLKIRHDHIIYTNREFYKKLINEGYAPVTKTITRYIKPRVCFRETWHRDDFVEKLETCFRLEKEGSFFDIPKIIYDYLSNNNNSIEG